MVHVLRRHHGDEAAAGQRGQHRRAINGPEEMDRNRQPLRQFRGDRQRLFCQVRPIHGTRRRPIPTASGAAAGHLGESSHRDRWVRATRSATLPKTTRPTEPRPCVVITTRLTASCSIARAFWQEGPPLTPELPNSGGNRRHAPRCALVFPEPRPHPPGGRHLAPAQSPLHFGQRGLVSHQMFQGRDCGEEKKRATLRQEPLCVGDCLLRLSGTIKGDETLEESRSDPAVWLGWSCLKARSRGDQCASATSKNSSDAQRGLRSPLSGRRL